MNMDAQPVVETTDSEDTIRFEELGLQPLTDRDRDLFLSLLDNPPPPTPAMKRAHERYKDHIKSDH